MRPSETVRLRFDGPPFWPAGFLAAVAFFVGVGFVFGCGTSGADAFFSDSVAVFISFLLTGLR
jgi:hypothetical protein